MAEEHKGMQTYITSVEAKTSMKLAELLKIVRAQGFPKAGPAIAWLKSEYGLGHGHANFVAIMAVTPEKFNTGNEDALGALFKGNKEKWRKTYDGLAAKVLKFGADADASANNSYVNLLRGGKKFGIVQISSAERMDIGIKLKGVAAEGRLEPAGSWNAMLTHRVRITDAKQVDAEVVAWLKRAYEAVK
jgi:Domain of unknown function (DUF4287)/Domain of unknown function (DUF5655)